MGARTARRYRGAAVRHPGERIVIDLDQGGGILRHLTAVRHHDRKRLARVNRLTIGKCKRHVELRDRRARHEQRQGILAQLIRQVREGQHQVYARVRLCGRRIDAADHGMRIGAAHEGRMQRAGQPDIVDEAPAARQ